MNPKEDPAATSEQILDLMLQLNRNMGVTFLFSTHDPRVMQHAHRVVRIADGGIVDEGGAPYQTPAAPH